MQLSQRMIASGVLPARGGRSLIRLEGVPAGGQQLRLLGRGYERVAVEEAVGDLQQRAVRTVVAHQHACTNSAKAVDTGNACTAIYGAV